MKICICCTTCKDRAVEYVKPMASFLQKLKAKVYFDDELYAKVPGLFPSLSDDVSIDIFVVIGGDGTALYYHQKHKDRKRAVFTVVNLGSLGFLADINVNEFEGYFVDLINKNYNVEKRLMLEGENAKGEKFYAVNDFVIHRGRNKTSIELNVLVNGKPLNTFHADGLIICTPTGSTAYSLAAGGPLIHPTTQAYGITPINVHHLSNRPLVLDTHNVLEIEYISGHDPVDVTVDGVFSYPLCHHETTKIFTSKRTFNLIAYPNKTDYYETLRNKLLWTGRAYGNLDMFKYTKTT